MTTLLIGVAIGITAMILICFSAFDSFDKYMAKTGSMPVLKWNEKYYYGKK